MVSDYDGVNVMAKLLKFLAEKKERGNTTESVEVGIGEMRMARAPIKLITRNLGSCVGVVLYDCFNKLGILIHVKLPTAEGVKNRASSASYAELAIPLAISELEKEGTRAGLLVAKIVGGSSMFPIKDPNLMIGKNNLNTIKRILRELNIKIVAEHSGGTHSRTMEFDTETGKVRLRLDNGQEELL